MEKYKQFDLDTCSYDSGIEIRCLICEEQIPYLYDLSNLVSWADAHLDDCDSNLYWLERKNNSRNTDWELVDRPVSSSRMKRLMTHFDSFSYRISRVEERNI